MITISDLMLGGLNSAPSDSDVVKAAHQAMLHHEHSPGARVPKSWFADPFALLDTLGLGYKASPSSLSYETLRQMAEKNVIVAAIIQTRVHQVASFCTPQRNKYSIGYRIRHVDEHRRLSRSELERIREIETFLTHTGEKASCVADQRDDRFPDYVKKLVRDRLTYDQIATEVVPRYNGKPYEFYAVPANTIRLASQRYRAGPALRPEDARRVPRYVQVIDGTIVNTYFPGELAFSVANPRTDIRSHGYGYSELEMLINTVTAHIWAEEWNRKVFSQGATTKGILNIKGNIAPQQLDAFKRMWLTQLSGVSNAWRTPVLNSNDDIQWVNLQPTNNEMGFQQWMEYLIKIASAVYLIDPSEINFDIRGGVGQSPMFMTTNEAQQKVSKDRGLKPLLGHVETHLNRYLIEPYDERYVFEFVGLDAQTEAQALDLRLKELQSYKTINEVRAVEQLAPVPYGDVIPNPSYIGYRNQQEMAKQQAQGGMPGMPGAGGGQPGASEAPGGIPGFSPASTPPGAPEKALETAVRKETGGKRAEPVHEVKPDRYSLDESEEWETTYRAMTNDLKKALEPLHALAQN